MGTGCQGPFCHGTGGWCGCNCKCCPPSCCSSVEVCFKCKTTTEPGVPCCGTEVPRTLYGHFSNKTGDFIGLVDNCTFRWDGFYWRTYDVLPTCGSSSDLEFSCIEDPPGTFKFYLMSGAYNVANGPLQTSYQCSPFQIIWNVNCGCRCGTGTYTLTVDTTPALAQTTLPLPKFTEPIRNKKTRWFNSGCTIPEETLCVSIYCEGNPGDPCCCLEVTTPGPIPTTCCINPVPARLAGSITNKTGGAVCLPDSFTMEYGADLSDPYSWYGEIDGSGCGHYNCNILPLHIRCLNPIVGWQCYGGGGGYWPTVATLVSVTCDPFEIVWDLLWTVPPGYCPPAGTGTCRITLVEGVLATKASNKRSRLHDDVIYAVGNGWVTGPTTVTDGHGYVFDVLINGLTPPVWVNDCDIITVTLVCPEECPTCECELYSVECNTSAALWKKIIDRRTGKMKLNPKTGKPLIALNKKELIRRILARRQRIRRKLRRKK